MQNKYKENESLNRFNKITRPIKRIYKLLFSYLKSNWDLDDYPIEFRQQQMLDLSESNLTMYPWEARVVNWYWMNADGHSKSEAYLKLSN